MQPNQQRDSRPFKVPEARARSRQTAAAAASSAAGSVVADPNQPHESDTASVPWSDPNTALSAAEPKVAEDVVIYAKPEYSASQFMQLGGTQPTQLADVDALELDEGKVTFACMHGHGSTMGADLSLDKDVYLFGTTPECDVIINHSHWHRSPVPPERTHEPWFKLYVQPSRSSPGDTKVYIEDISNGGVLLNGKPMVKRDRKLLRWGDIITAGEAEAELFRYSYRSIDNSPSEDIQGDKSIYRLEKITLGTGNYSQVVKAYDVRTKAVYACKVIDRLNREFNQLERDGIALEIDLLKDLDHKNILKFIDVSQEKYKTYIFTEYIEGVTLYGHYRDVNNYMSEVDTRHIFAQVCRAVEYLHKNNIVHRDIKSENIMITPNQHVKLIDFGLARHCVASRPVLSTLCGTPSYMSPEIALGEDSNGYGKPVDVWALGVVLFRMLTGSYPFHSDQYDNEHDRPLGVKAENTQGEAVDREREEGVNKLEVEYRAGRQPYYKKNWRPHLDKKAPRSPEVLRLLERMLKTDPSQRVRIEHVLTDDWFLMMDEHLEKFEASSGTTFAGLRSETGSVEDPASVAAWGELVLLPGCVSDAPRHILLSKDQTWFGRDPKDVDVHLGNSVMLSGVHCLIDRSDNGEIMVTNASRNGTFINSLKIEIQRASQLLCGDELGFIMPPDDPNIVSTAFLPRKATEDDRIRRRYADSTYQYEPRGRPRKAPDSTGEVWAILKPLNEGTQVQELTQRSYIFGRNEDCDVVIRNPFVSRTHCVLEWVLEDRQAYLKNLTLCGTYVNNGLTCQDRLQLRHGDKIYLRRNIPRSPDEVGVCVGYTIEFTDAQHIRKRQAVGRTPQDAKGAK
ncbi:Meiosis-specific serine/threonine-protein kinase mek1 [Mortierella alpina]|nr:Meiosis-specific serine/threonine-protein kinase mek1 [Mortierella alpina]